MKHNVSVDEMEKGTGYIQDKLEIFYSYMTRYDLLSETFSGDHGQQLISEVHLLICVVCPALVQPGTMRLCGLCANIS